MRNTYNISRLRARILAALPRPPSPVGAAALDGFLSLPGVSVWSPGRIGLIELSFVFDIGLPLALIGDNPSVRPYAMQAGDAVRGGRPPPPDRWRIVHVAALLTHWGAVVEFSPSVDPQSLPLAVHLPGGDTLGVAVVAAQRAFRLDAVTGLSPAADVPRSCLLAVDASGGASAHQQILADCMTDPARSPLVSGILSFEPRFWVGIEQKEWVHSARLNPHASVAIPGAMVGGADGARHALRIALLV